MQRIMVVEDDFDIQELLKNFLQEAGYVVVTADVYMASSNIIIGLFLIKTLCDFLPLSS